MSSTFQTDFDRIALVSPEGELHNEHYHKFLLDQLPPHCDQVLEIGCGAGTFARALAARSNHVLGIDLSPEMIRLARERSTELSQTRSQHARGQQAQGREAQGRETQGREAQGQQAQGREAQGQEGGMPPLSLSNIDFQVGDILECELPDEHFDCIASIATLHHLPFRDVLLKIKAALKPGGVMLILDLFEPQRPLDNLFKRGSFANFLNPRNWFDYFSNFVALPVSVSLRLFHQRRLRPRRGVRAAWAAHEAHDIYPTMNEVRSICADVLPGAKVRKHLLWRYSIVWQKSNGNIVRPE